MSIPDPPQPPGPVSHPGGAWALGRYNGLIVQYRGLPALLWADTILPWSAPVPASADSTWPADWPLATPSLFVPGLYQRKVDEWGWERHMNAARPSPTSPTPARRSYPEGVDFNMLMLAGMGLQQRIEADTEQLPPRVQKGGLNEPSSQWPLDMQNGGTYFLDLYMRRFVEPTTKIVLQILERNIRAMYDPFYADDAAAGERGLQEYIWHALELWGPQIIAWNIFDEPEEHFQDDPGADPRVGEIYASSANLADLRGKIRQWEYAWRRDNETGFRNLSIDEQRARLRPVCMTFRDVYLLIDDIARQRIGSYRQAADIFFFDRYPYRLRPADLLTDGFAGVPLETGLLESANESESVQFTLECFDRLREYINTNPQGVVVEMGNIAYRPVVNWAQASGGISQPAYRTSDGANVVWPPSIPQTVFDDLVPAPQWQADAPPPPSTTVPLDPDDLINRTRRLPSLDELRFFVWVSILLLQSEGMPCWSLPGVPASVIDSLIDGRFSHVAREVSYFSGLRVQYFSRQSGIDQSHLLNSRFYVFHTAERPRIGPRVWYFTFDREEPEQWIFILNPLARNVGLRLDPATSIYGPEGEFGFVEWKLGGAIGSPRQFLGPNYFTIPALSFSLLKRVAMP